MNLFTKIIFSFSALIKWMIAYHNSKLLINKIKPIHILFCMVDHYEPNTGKVSDYVAQKRIATLIKKYPLLVKQHKDSEGHCPKRTWFVPPNQHKNHLLKNLTLLCEKGFGEIEFHLHHGKKCPDTSKNLKETILQTIEEYSRFGIFGKEKGEIRYGFIHGDWALDNSRNNKYCGVNNELSILKETGCYADFTFPSKNEANPALINSIYYAIDDPNKPKSYNRGTKVSVKKCLEACYKIKNRKGLMIIQGPMYPFLKNNQISGLRISNDVINGSPPITKKRVDSWIKTGIHIKGKNNWRIIKVHTHGATDSDAVLGQEMDDIFSYLESKYNDGQEYILHYLTARELFNIIKAIEDGRSGENPSSYKNYIIAPPKYNVSTDIPEASPRLKSLISKSYED